jgi:ankyrin repeat protein
VQPIHFAALGGHTLIVKQLVAAGSEIDIGTKRDKENALQLSASRGRTETVEYLISCGAQLDHVNVNQCSALHLAARRNHVSWLQIRPVSRLCSR